MQFISGKRGRACGFDGSSYVLVADSAVLNPVSGITAGAWIMPSAYPQGDCDHRSLLAKTSDTATAWFLALYHGGHLRFVVYGPEGAYMSGYTANDTVPLNSWTHVVATYDAMMKAMKVYVNGTSVGVTPNGQSGSVGSLRQLPVPLLVATGRIAQPDPESFVGGIDDVILFNRALSDAEVLQLFQSGPMP